MLDRPTDINLQHVAQQQEYVAIADRVAAAGPRTTLDWGCGWGQVSALLAERGLSVTSFDYGGPDAPDATVALERYPGLQRHLSSDPIALPYGDSSFDAVLSCGVLEHVQDPDASLDELHRVLRPGGMLFVFKLPNRHSYLEAIARRAGMYYHGREPFDTVYTLASARAIVAGHGFEVLESRYANMLPLTVGGPRLDRHGRRLFAANVAMARLPGLRRLATNVDVIARAEG